MPVSQYTVQFTVDGNATSTPTALTIIPGTNVTWLCVVDEAIGGVTRPFSLKEARIWFEMRKNDGSTALFQEGSPTILLDDTLAGHFTINFTPRMTAYLTDGSYTMEIKTRLVNGALRRIGEIPVMVLPSRLANQF